jgi:aconitate hydratase 2/2-methylisocitrate dehydratase
VEPGVSKAAKVKAAWLEQVAQGQVQIAGCAPEAAVAMLAQMGGGYNVAALIRLLQIPALAQVAAEALKGLTKIYEAFDQVVQLAQTNPAAESVLESWAAAEWFTRSPQLPEKIVCTAYRVEGEINTDDFSPGNQAQSRLISAARHLLRQDPVSGRPTNHCPIPWPGKNRGLCRRRGRHRVVAQVGDQFSELAAW